MRARYLYLLGILFICYQVSHGNISKAQAQSQELSTPMGNVISISPGTSINQASPATVFFTRTITANTLMPNRWYPLKLYFQLTTPLVSIPGISITVQYGSQTYNIMSSAALVGGITNGLFTIDLELLGVTTTSQRLTAVVTQPNGSLISLGSAYSPVGSFTVNSAVDNTFSVTVQFTGLNLGTTTLTNYWIKRDPF